MNLLSKQNIKRFIKIFFIALLMMVAVSHEQIIKQIFDYKEIYFKTISETSEEKQETIEASKPEIKFPYSEKNNFIEIPKLNMEAPIVFTENADPENLEKMLDSGVTHFPESVLPLEKGTTIFLGHSAPTGWPKIKHDWVFSKIIELEKGDEILIYFDNKKITYNVTDKIFLEKGEEIPEKGEGGLTPHHFSEKSGEGLTPHHSSEGGENGERSGEGLTNYENTLVLISCWPPGKDSKRIAIMSELKINNNK